MWLSAARVRFSGSGVASAVAALLSHTRARIRAHSTYALSSSATALHTRARLLHGCAAASGSAVRRTVSHSSSSSSSSGSGSSSGGAAGDADGDDVRAYDAAHVRNFCIIAHIDHGKSTLADRLLQYTGVIGSNAQAQFLDNLQVERERGITVRAQSATMFHTHGNERYMLNLIDTPGHVDFSYEVSRALAACQGALLVVDAAQGVQAQTMSTFFAAFDRNLHIIPVLNKVDLPTANVERCMEQLHHMFGFEEREVLQVSAKTGLGVDKLLAHVIRTVPAPTGSEAAPMRALVFDTWFDTYRGVILLAEVLDGRLTLGSAVESVHNARAYTPVEIGILSPGQKPVASLGPGQVGYIVTGVRSAREFRVGDTLRAVASNAVPVPGFKPAKAMVFAGLYPVDASEFDELNDALEKIMLTDSSIAMERESSSMLGFGFRVGFLGMLHMDVFMQRLQQEYGADVIATAPTVPYRVLRRTGDWEVVDSPNAFPDDSSAVQEVHEPFIAATIVTPTEYLGAVLSLCQQHRGEQKSMEYIDSQNVVLKYELPLGETIATNFYDRLKGNTRGFASFDYEEGAYRPSSIVKVAVLVNGEPVDALSFLTHRDRAERDGRKRVERLAEVMRRQMFEIVLQAAVRNRVIARETIRAFRKDVTAKCYGGDVTRKRKLLEKQKEGKRRMRQFGNVEIPHEAFLSVLKRD